ncbi:MAG: glycosyltransferase family 2 protein [Planctomycetota bacterium]
MSDSPAIADTPGPTAEPGRIDACVFARNEQDRLPDAVGSLLSDAAADRVRSVHLMVNGCTDDTPAVARSLAERDPRVVVHELPIGDKCNAWNAYVHQVVPTLSGPSARADDAAHVFMDGDVRCGPGAIAAMTRRLADVPRAYACAGLPLSGRNRAEMARLVVERRWVFGNLYVARGSHLARLADAGFRLPLGLMGNDHLITRAMKTALPDADDIDHGRVVWADGVGYAFDSLSPWRIEDVRIYQRRRVTYALRHEQLTIVGTVPLDRLPRTMDPINRRVLDKLNGLSLTPWDLRLAVRRKLGAMYPDLSTPHYRRMLGRAA